MFRNTKRKSKKKKARKSNKKRLFKPRSFLIIVIGTLLVFILLQMYQFDIQKEKGKITLTITKKERKPEKTRQPAKPEYTSPQKTENKEKVPSKKAPKPAKNQTSKSGKRPFIPSITDHTDLKYPVSYTNQPEQVIFHTGHTVSYNKDWKIPNWVSYELTRAKTKGDEKRQSRFVPDPKVKEGTATDADYRRSGYDRGHMAPAADMKWSSNSMKESFYFSNVCPQHPQLNQRRWKDLENKVRGWAIADSAIIVICGPLVNEKPECIGSNQVVVPHGFFKIVLSPFITSPQAIGFVFNNAHSTAPLRSHIVSVDSIETLTGLDFFAPLPNHIEAPLEAYVDTLYWGL